MPPGLSDDPELQQIVLAAADASRKVYDELLDKLEAKLADQPNAVLRRKRGPPGRPCGAAQRHRDPHRGDRQLPLWRHFIAMRASEHADTEIRRLAIACLRELAQVAPAVFADFEISVLADGSEVATSPLATEA